MAYFIRILGISDHKIHIDDIILALADKGLTANFDTEENDSPDNWSVVNVANVNDEDLMSIHRNKTDEKTGKWEIAEFKDEVIEYKPIQLLSGFTNI